VKIAYIDIETNYVGMFTDQRLFRDHKNHRITVLGVRVLQEDKDSFLQLVGKDVSKVAMLSALTGMDLIVTYNGRSIPDNVKGYTGFDFPVIASQLGLVLDNEFKHLDLCPVCWQHGLWGGQKAIERSLGLRRKLPGRDGAWAAITWKRYKTTGDENFLKELLEYNREDVFMLGRIEAALYKCAPTSTHSHSESAPKTVFTMDSLQLLSRRGPATRHREAECPSALSGDGAEVCASRLNATAIHCGVETAALVPLNPRKRICAMVETE
jgi:uncharacterized protein YprB with RNaseH-like and TPR domain